MPPRDADVRLSKKLSWLLRHGAAEAGVTQSEDGFVALADALRVAQCSRETLDRVAQENAKKRFEIVGDRIRAVQGHSSGRVDASALEATYTPYEGADVILHGTSLAAAGAIVREGIRSQARTHVHFATSTTSVVGKRASVDVFVEVSVSALQREGIAVFVAPNGVVLAREAPTCCIVGVRAARDDREAEVADLRRVLLSAAREDRAADLAHDRGEKDTPSGG